MNIIEKPMWWYISQLRYPRYFCFPGYSDAEWYCMMGIRPNMKSGLGQVLSPKHGEILTDIMRRRQNDKRWLWAVPKVLPMLPAFQRESIDDFLRKRSILIKAYERDRILDDAARDAKLHDFIHQLQMMDTVVIGPDALEPHIGFLDFKKFVGIETPNLHMTEGGIDKAVARAKGYKGVVYLISAGVSAPVIIDKLYHDQPNNFYIDCGSIWDAFAGIGGQRQWRADLYAAGPEAIQKWKDKNLYGV